MLAAGAENSITVGPRVGGRLATTAAAMNMWTFRIVDLVALFFQVV
jgi:hypothetical protein